MTRFSATTKSTAVVPTRRSDIWKALTDPELLPQLTPLLRHITTDGDLWTWHMTRIAALGVSIIPAFTERMIFETERRIEYHHEPPQGSVERSGADGWYELADVDGGTELKISLTLEIEVPLPNVLAPAVRRIMKATMDRTGDRFSENLLKHLGVDDRSSRTFENPRRG